MKFFNSPIICSFAGARSGSRTHNASRIRHWLFAIVVISFATLAQIGQSEPPPLQIVKTIPLLGVTGKFDHFAIDTAGNRLFVAATGNHSVEVVNLTTGKVEQSITGLGKPHGLAWIEHTHSLYVADGSLAELRCYQGSSLKLTGTLKLSNDADDMVYNEANHLLFVGHGGSDAASPALIAVVDTDTFDLKANIPVATHPEALDIDVEGQRVFANIADSSEVALLDGAGKAVTSRWKLAKASDNVPLAYDASHHVLYVACRKPASLIAIDATSGKELSAAPIGQGADDLFYNSALHRVYVISGASEVDEFQIDSSGGLHSLGIIHTAPGAKTALFVPSQALLYVGVPGIDGHPSEIRVYATTSRRPTSEVK